MAQGREGQGGNFAERFAAIALMAVPLFVALYLPKIGALPIGQVLVEAKILALRWAYGVSVATLAMLLVLQMPRRWSLRAWVERLKQRADGLALLLLVAFLAWSIVAMLAGRAPVLSWRESAPLYFPASLTLLIGLAGLRLPVLRILLFGSLGGIIIALVTLLQRVGVNPYAFAYDFDVIFAGSSERGRLIASLGNAEYLGGYLAAMGAIHATLVIALILEMTRGRDNPVQQVSRRLSPRLRLIAIMALGGGALLEIVALLFTGTRSALPALAAGILWGCLVLLYLNNFSLRALVTRRNLGRFSAVAGCGLILVLAISPLRNQVRRLIVRYAAATDLQSDSIRERSIYSMAAGEMLARNPVTGVGPGLYNSSFYITMYDAAQESSQSFTWRRLLSFGSTKGAGNAHNEYAQWAGETGWIGLFLLLGLLTSLLMLPWAGHRPPGGAASFVPSAEAASAAGLAAMLTSALVSFPFRTSGRAALLWLIIALVMAAARNRRTKLNAQSSTNSSVGARS